MSATGTAGEFDAALSVKQNQYHVPAQAGGNGLNPIPAQNVHATAQSPLLPYRLSNFVLAILGLSNYGPYASQSAHVNTRYLKPQPGNSSACLALTGLPNACNLPSDFAANYGLNGLYHQGANGSGQTLGHRHPGRGGPGRAAVLLEQHRARPEHRPQLHRAEHRRWPGRAEQHGRHR